MLGIGDRFPDFSLTALVPGDLSAVDAKLARRLLHEDRLVDLRGQVEGRLLLAEGLHLCLPDRDRRVRAAQQRVRRP